MDSLHLTNLEDLWSRTAFGRGIRVVIGAVATLALAGSGAAQPQNQGVNPPDVASESPFGVYLPTDRTLSRGVAQARERIGDREYNEAIGFLQGILDRDEDEFIEDAAGVFGESRPEDDCARTDFDIACAGPRSISAAARGRRAAGT